MSDRTVSAVACRPRRWHLYFIIALLPGCQYPAATCTDYLSRWSPPTIEGAQFRRCDQQAAVYRIEGKAVARAEKILQDRFGMGALRFACCGWEAHPPGQRISAGQYFLLHLYSAETLVRDRREIGRVVFTLRVEPVEPP